MWKRTTRIIAATLIAPWMTLPAVGLHLAITGTLLDHDATDASMNHGPFVLYGMIIAYPVTVLFGIPAHLLLCHFRIGYIWTHALIGGLIAFLFGVLALNLLAVENWQVFLIYSSLLVVPGVLVAATFGVIAGKASPGIRPDVGLGREALE